MYRQGTISVTTGQNQVVGTDTLFRSIGNIQAGSLITFDGSTFYYISAVIDDDTLTIETVLDGQPYQGVTLTNASYAIMLPIGAGFTGAVALRTLETQQIQQARDRAMLDFFYTTAPTVTLVSYTGETFEMKSAQEIDRLAQSAAAADGIAANIEDRLQTAETALGNLETQLTDFNTDYSDFVLRYADVDTWYQGFTSDYPVFQTSYANFTNTLYPAVVQAKADAETAKTDAQAAQLLASKYAIAPDNELVEGVNRSARYHASQAGISQVDVQSKHTDINAWYDDFSANYPLFVSAYDAFVNTHLVAATTAANDAQTHKQDAQTAKQLAAQYASAAPGVLVEGNYESARAYMLQAQQFANDTAAAVTGDFATNTRVDQLETNITTTINQNNALALAGL